MNANLFMVQDGPVLKITVNRPDRGNAFTDDMISELADLVEGAGKTSELVIIRGIGKDFCIGRDAAPAPADPLERRRWADAVFRCYGALRNSVIPVIAVVRGKAFGFGCAIAAVSDITLASGHAKFQVPEMAHNIMPGNVLSAFVDRVPRKAMHYLILTTAQIDAAQAQLLGIVSAIASEEKLDSLVSEVSDRILASSGAAVRAVKEYIRSAPDMPIDGAVEFARSLHAAVNSSNEMRNLPSGRRD
jgi:enoyl-CoA hydratase